MIPVEEISITHAPAAFLFGAELGAVILAFLIGFAIIVLIGFGVWKGTKWLLGKFFTWMADRYDKKLEKQQQDKMR